MTCFVSEDNGEMHLNAAWNLMQYLAETNLLFMRQKHIESWGSVLQLGLGRLKEISISTVKIESL